MPKNKNPFTKKYEIKFCKHTGKMRLFALLISSHGTIKREVDLTKTKEHRTWTHRGKSLFAGRENY